MAKTSTVNEFFGLKNLETGELVRMHNADCAYPQGEAYATLTADESDPYLQCKTQAAVELILLSDTPGYNATPETPSWGRFKREQLALVRVRVVQEVEDIEHRPLLSVATIELRSIPYSVAKGYAGHELDPLAKTEVVFWLVHLPEGVTLEAAQGYEGQMVFGGNRWTRRKLFKALPVPADYADLTKGKPAALFLASLIQL